jgi:hypothetical protein
MTWNKILKIKKVKVYFVGEMKKKRKKDSQNLSITMILMQIMKTVLDNKK